MTTTSPFDDDVKIHGSYQYTKAEILSARVSNSRITKEIALATDFKNKTVLDIGCGDGKYSFELFNIVEPKHLLGIDPASLAIDHANQYYAKSNLSFSCDTTDTIITKGLHFDIAVLRGVLHHADKYPLLIEHAHKIADIVIILEPNGWNPILKIIEKISPYHIAHKERSFFVETLEKEIRNSQGVVKKKYFFGLVPFFCPNFLVPLLVFLQPIVERLPLIRRVGCGQVLIISKKR